VLHVCCVTALLSPSCSTLTVFSMVADLQLAKPADYTFDSKACLKASLLLQ